VSFPASRVEVDACGYIFTHGKYPRGFGDWAFRVGTGPKRADLSPGLFRVCGTFTLAKREARRFAGSLDMPYVQVQP